MSALKNDPHVEVRPIRQGIITRGYLAVVHVGDEVRQKAFPVEIGSGTKQSVAIAAYNWGRSEGRKIAAQIRQREQRQKRYIDRDTECIASLIDDTAIRAAQVRLKEEQERKAEAKRHAEAVARATVSLRHALSMFPKAQNAMKASYPNVYGELARCPWS